MVDSKNTIEKPPHLRELYDSFRDPEYESQLRLERIASLTAVSGCGIEYRNGDLHLDTWNEPYYAKGPIQEWVRGIGEKPGLYVHGSVGTGKTHLAQAAIVEAIRVRVRRARFIAASELIQQARETHDDNSTMTLNAFVDHWGSIPLLALDDLGVDRATDFSVEVLYRVLDRRVSTEMPTLITSNHRLSMLGERLAPMGSRDTIEAERILDRLQQHCVKIEIVGESHRA